MLGLLTRVLLVLHSLLEVRATHEAEILVLRQQLLVRSRRSPKRIRLRNIDRLIVVWLCRLFPSLLDAVVIVKPETVLRWHRRGFRSYWRWKSWRHGVRPRIDRELRELIRRNEQRKSALGSAAYPRRIADARDRRQRINRWAVHDQNRATAFAGLEDVPA